MEDKTPRHVYAIFTNIYEWWEKYFKASWERLNLESLPTFLLVRKDENKEEYVRSDKICYVKYYWKHDNWKEVIENLRW